MSEPRRMSDADFDALDGLVTQSEYPFPRRVELHAVLAAALSSPETTPAGVLPPNTRLILASDNLLDEWGTRTDRGERITVEWGESSPEGWYLPLFTTHSDDRIGVLDEAWAAAEKALPEGWRPIHLAVDDDDWTRWEAITSSRAFFEDETSDESQMAEGSGPTPAAALHALAAALGRSGSGGGRG